MTTLNLQNISWGNAVSDDFLQEVSEVCNHLGWVPAQISHLMACMAFETGEKFSPSVKNAAGSGATGLIQFMPATARGLGTTTDLLAHMTAEEQLAYVALYFKPYAKRIKTLSDMYMAILLPKYIGAEDSAILFANGTTAYRQNSGLDGDSDGVITKAEASAKVLSKLTRGFGPKFVKVMAVPYA